MLSQDSRNFRIAVCALALTAGLLLVVFGLGLENAEASVSFTNPTVEELPRLSTPVEIAQAMLYGKIDALRKHGFNRFCLLSVEIQGELCIERCIPQDVGFYIAIGLNKPECQVLGCGCEGEEMEMFPQEPAP